MQDGNTQNNSNSSSPTSIISDQSNNTGGRVHRKLARASEDSGNGMTLESSMDEIREELLEIAEQIKYV